MLGIECLKALVGSLWFVFLLMGFLAVALFYGAFKLLDYVGSLCGCGFDDRFKGLE
jgi:hypothetical protein